MTYEEAFKHPQFLIFFEEEIQRIETARRKVLLDGNIRKKVLKSVPYSKLKEQGLLTVEWMTNEFTLIRAKISDQPVHIRVFIDQFIHNVSYRTVIYVDKQNKNESTN